MSLRRGFVTTMPFCGLGSKNNNKKKDEHSLKEKPEIAYCCIQSSEREMEACFS
jgi:hypothetical protein